MASKQTIQMFKTRLTFVTCISTVDTCAFKARQQVFIADSSSSIATSITMPGPIWHHKPVITARVAIQLQSQCDVGRVTAATCVSIAPVRTRATFTFSILLTTTSGSDGSGLQLHGAVC